jgi:hypothetical protein
MRLRNDIFAPTATVFALLVLHPRISTPAESAAVVPSLEVEYRAKVFENADFAAYRVTIPPRHATVMHRHDTDILTVFISGGPTKTVIMGEAPREEVIPEGSVRFRSAGFTHATENPGPGPGPFTFVVLEFKKSVGTRRADVPAGSRSCGPSDDAACVEQKYVLCTTLVCAKTVLLGPKAEMDASAADTAQMLVAVSTAHLSRDGESGLRSFIRKNGEVEYLEPVAKRRWRNEATLPAHLVILEFGRAKAP